MTHEPPREPGAGSSTTTDAVAPEDMSPVVAANPFQKTPVSRTPVIFGAVGLVAGLALGLLAGQVDFPAQSSAIQEAVAACGVEDDEWIVVGDEGASVSIDTEGKESSGTAYTNVTCVLDELGMPDSVSSRMGNTRALDGRQDAQWGEFSATWGYHPDSGMNVVVEIVEAK
ncbi:hypothetical protein [Arthrobacter caoxuetaonis]|uniref:Uncharacterized protein n=1 Tax=Arthrobacter caoxuetaonis TaxID=2886935 RepID=A0A9X1MCE8_9MICC|nr:hypothetical protein [Arthrobacter caoxuetaonis]MCC3296822.1 hypothetical protein [Arthrobacter caoxuetaonis]USQ56360.1 hypothetical protein NF551_11435 [Arthrobacter caoxuetaonis]